MKKLVITFILATSVLAGCTTGNGNDISNESVTREYIKPEMKGEISI